LLIRSGDELSLQISCHLACALWLLIFRLVASSRRQVKLSSFAVSALPLIPESFWLRYHLAVNSGFQGFAIKLALSGFALRAFAFRLPSFGLCFPACAIQLGLSDLVLPASLFDLKHLALLHPPSGARSF